MVVKVIDVERNMGDESMYFMGKTADGNITVSFSIDNPEPWQREIRSGEWLTVSLEPRREA